MRSTGAERALHTSEAILLNRLSVVIQFLDGYSWFRGGTGISKVVRPLQIKDTRECARGGLQQAMCGSKNYLWNQNAWVPMQFGQAAPGS